MSCQIKTGPVRLGCIFIAISSCILELFFLKNNCLAGRSDMHTMYILWVCTSHQSD